MPKAAKIVMACLIVTTCVAFSSAVMFFIMMEGSVKDQLIAEKNRAESEALREEVHDRLTAVITDKEELARQVTDLKEKSLKLAQQLDADRLERQQLEETYNERIGSFDQISYNLDNQRVQNNALADRVDELERALSAAQNETRRLRNENEKISQALNKQPAVSSETVTAHLPRPVAEGMIMVINADAGYVVINIGERAPIAIGDTLGVFHDDQLVGKLQVEEINNMVSTTRPLSPGLFAVISEGDHVRVL